MSREFDLVAHLARQHEWSERTFGPGARTAGVIDHIRKELREIEAEPSLEEWIDVVILALDGAWRIGASPEQIIAAMVAKQTKNEGRKWPDWRDSPPDKAIEHDRNGEETPDVGPNHLEGAEGEVSGDLREGAGEGERGEPDPLDASDLDQWRARESRFA